MKKLELKIPPPIVLLTLIALVYGLNQASVLLSIPAILSYLQYPLIVLGCLVAILGLWEFRKVKTTINPHTPNKTSNLVTAGVYNITRNPMYLGMLFVLLGAILRFENALGFIALPMFIGYINRYQIKPEEQMIEQLFGQEYLEYKNKVRRWI